MKLPTKKKAINEDVPLIYQLHFSGLPINYDNRITPTRDQIDSMTAAIRDTWDHVTERSRRSCVTLKEDDYTGWSIPLVKDTRPISSRV